MSEQAGGFVPPEQSTQPERIEAAQPNPAPISVVKKRPFFDRLRERIAAWDTKRKEISQEPKPIELKHISVNKYALRDYSVLNRLTELPVPHQMRALELVYEERQREENFPGRSEFAEEQEIITRILLEYQQKMLDNFAIDIELDPEKRETALRLQKENSQALQESKQKETDSWIKAREEEKQRRQQIKAHNENVQAQIRKMKEHVMFYNSRKFREQKNLIHSSLQPYVEKEIPEPERHIYKRLDPNIFSPEVAQSRAVMEEVLRQLLENNTSSPPGYILRRILKHYDDTKHNFDIKYKSSS